MPDRSGPDSRAMPHHEPPSRPPSGTPRQGPTPAVQRRLAGIRILLVDDDADTRELLTLLLRIEGADVRSAESAKAARVALARHGVDVLVSDISMPDEDGYSLVTDIRRQGLGGQGLPALALTALARPEDRAAAREAGFDAHLSKPVSPDVLVTTILALVRSTGRAG